MKDITNIVTLRIITESGCSVEDGEYTVLLVSNSQPMSLDDDPRLILEGVEECIAAGQVKLLTEIDGETEVKLRLSGEWEDVDWNAYYVLESYAYIPYETE